MRNKDLVLRRLETLEGKLKKLRNKTIRKSRKKKEEKISIYIILKAKPHTT